MKQIVSFIGAVDAQQRKQLKGLREFRKKIASCGEKKTLSFNK